MARFIVLILLVNTCTAFSQSYTIKGRISSEGHGLFPASIAFTGQTSRGTQTDTSGFFELQLEKGLYKIHVSAQGYHSLEKKLLLQNDTSLHLAMITTDSNLDEIVITGTQKEVSRSESPVPVEVYTPTFFRKNPTPSLIDAMQTINGVRPQLNCNVCNTGDIHINGMEGPYTMVLIDGMPIVSALASVYGLSGIPNALIERVEVVKGPAASLYGSESVGGLINVITKKNKNAPVISADLFSTSWLEHNADLGFKIPLSKKLTVLTGINYFNYSAPKDNNNDHFTDVTLQNRISVFQKWDLSRKENRVFNLAGRYLFEDRWGGEMNWNTSFRGSDSVYGENINTRRWELLGTYQLPLKEKFLLSLSLNQHVQDSYYGTTPYLADQRIGFTQLTWDKTLNKHDLLAGSSLRYTYYDDNSTVTQTADSVNKASVSYLPGLFVQDEITLHSQHKLLLGARIDLHALHGAIYTPRIAYKWTVSNKHILRFNAGSGFRVVNLFSEDHAALTGARKVEIVNELKPEKSYNTNLNYIFKALINENLFFSTDASFFYTYFKNRILADYSSDPNKIIYDNLFGYSEVKGASLNLELSYRAHLKFIMGGTYIDARIIEKGTSTRQMLTERFSGTWTISYKHKKSGITLDYTGNVYSPMLLPTLGEDDPRQNMSPWWSLQNLQITYNIKQLEFYGGVKNFLNWTPNIGNPFIIARSHDPFDKQVKFDNNGQVIPTAENPYALTFDPSYVYGPNQGRRFFLGVRWMLN